MSQQAEEYKTPIYLVTGFLESGKTSLIKNMLEDEDFSAGERTLLIVCEEGEEEYDAKLLRKANTVLQEVESFEDLTPNLLNSLNQRILPERVIIRNTTACGAENLFRVKKPDDWELAQMVALIDATTFENYMVNMRQLMSEAPKLADLVIFNRCDENTRKSPYRRLIKAMNNTCTIIFENKDGTSDDGVGEEDLPYDMKADVIEIKDEDFGTWYLDCMEHPNRYDGRTVRVKGQCFNMQNLPKKTFVFGRYAMTCCAADVGGIGFLCRYADQASQDRHVVLPHREGGKRLQRDSQPRRRHPARNQERARRKARGRAGAVQPVIFPIERASVRRALFF